MTFTTKFLCIPEYCRTDRESVNPQVSVEVDTFLLRIGGERLNEEGKLTWISIENPFHRKVAVHKGDRDNTFH